MLLSVSSLNPRYFKKEDGSIVFLTGAHDWESMSDYTAGSPPSTFDFDAYLTQCQTYGWNFIRLWSSFAYPHPSGWSPTIWPRTGPGNASDGGLKYDVSQTNTTWMSRLRSRVEAARAAGIWVGVMFFVDPWGDFTLEHPFASGNNINSVAVAEADMFTNAASTAAKGFWNDHVDAVIDELNDLDNIIWEIMNEGEDESVSWQQDMISHIHTYEAGKSLQHPVWFTSYNAAGENTVLLASDAEAVSLRGHDGTGWVHDPEAPPIATTAKVSISDSDHIDSTGIPAGTKYLGGTVTNYGLNWIWKETCRGHQPILMGALQHPGPWLGAIPMNDPDDPIWSTLLPALGDARSYAERLTLAYATPSSTLSSTQYCLAYPGHDYLIYQPNNASFTVNMVAGNYTFEWFDPEASTVLQTGTVNCVSGNNTFSPPGGTWPSVLLLRASVESGLPTRMPESVGATYFVSYPGSGVTGDDNYSLAQAQNRSTPWASVEHALNVVSSGATIKILDGSVLTIYDDDFGSAFAVNEKRFSTSNPVTICAETNLAVTITTGTAWNSSRTYQQSGIWLYGSSGIRIRGLKFSKLFGHTAIASVGGVWIVTGSGNGQPGDNIEITECLFEDIGGTAYQVNGMVGNPCRNLWFYRNVIRPTGTTSVDWDPVNDGPNPMLGDPPDGENWWSTGMDAGPGTSSQYTNHYLRIKGTHGMYPYYTDGMVISNNLFIGASTGNMVHLGAGFNNGYITNNTFYGQRQGYYWGDPTVNAGNPSGVSPKSYHGMSAIELWGASWGNVVANNIFMNMDGHPVGTSNWGTGTLNNVTNNLAYDCDNCFDGVTSYRPDADDHYEETYEGIVQFTEAPGNLTSANPLFANATTATTYDFSLQQGSPAIGAALLEFTPPEDLYGNPRSDTAPSIGAIESSQGQPEPEGGSSLRHPAPVLADGSSTAGFTTAFVANAVSATTGSAAVPIVEAVTTATAINDTYDLTINKPTGTVSGDVLIAVVALDYNDTNTWTTPSGWVFQGTAKTSHGTSGLATVMSCYSRRADGTEGSSFTFTESGMLHKNGLIARISGVDAGVTDLTHQFATFNDTTSSTSHTSPSITTTEDNCLILSFFSSGWDNADASSAAGSETEIADFNNAGSDYLWMSAYRTDKATAGAVTHSITLDNTSPVVSITLAINPGSGGGGSSGLRASSAPGGAYYGGSSGSTLVRAKVSIAPAAGNDVQLHWRAQNAARSGVPAASSSDWSGYSLELTSGSSSVVVSRWNGTTRTVIDTFTQAWVAGDEFAVTHIGSFGSVWRKTSSTEWTSIGDFTDSTYSEGYCGIELEDTTARITDYGGGAPIIRLGVIGVG